MPSQRSPVEAAVPGPAGDPGPPEPLAGELPAAPGGDRHGGGHAGPGHGAAALGHTGGRCRAGAGVTQVRLRTGAPVGAVGHTPAHLCVGIRVRVRGGVRLGVFVRTSVGTDTDPAVSSLAFQTVRPLARTGSFIQYSVVFLIWKNVKLREKLCE